MQSPNLKIILGFSLLILDILLILGNIVAVDLEGGFVIDVNVVPAGTNQTTNHSSDDFNDNLNDSYNVVIYTNQNSNNDNSRSSINYNSASDNSVGNNINSKSLINNINNNNQEISLSKKNNSFNNQNSLKLNILLFMDTLLLFIFYLSLLMLKFRSNK